MPDPFTEGTRVELAERLEARKEDQAFRVKDGVNPRPWKASPSDRFVDCFDCGFVFSAEHMDPGGGYTCPLCAPAPSVRQEGTAQRLWPASAFTDEDRERLERLHGDGPSFGPATRALAHIDRLEKALREIADELGVPDDNYPAPVANAAELARAALKGEDDA